jgi:hypothetical protein
MNHAVRAELVCRLVERVHTTTHRPHLRRRPYGPVAVDWPNRLRSYFWPEPSLDLAATEFTMATLY